LPDYRPPDPSLDELVQAFDVLISERGRPAAEELREAAPWLSLPRYARQPDQETALALLFADILEVIEAQRGVDRLHLRYLFRVDAADEGVSARRDLAADLYPTKLSGSGKLARDWRVVARLAFELYRRALDLVAPDYELDFGFRSISHDWSVELKGERGLDATYTFRTQARAIRPGQRFYVFGGNLGQARLLERPWVPEHQQRAGHHYVGTVQVDWSNPAVLFHVIYLGRAIDIDEEVEVAVCRRVEENADDPPGIFIESRGPEIRAITLSVRSDRENLRNVEAIERTALGVLPRGEPRPVAASNICTDEASAHFEPTAEGHEYELTWEIGT
jgi:hypothetical protein